MTQSNKTGAEQIQWDLSDLYQSADDDQLNTDEQKLKDLTQQFTEKYHRKVASLGADKFLEALKAYEAILDLAGKLGSYAQLLWSTDTNNPEYGKLMQNMQEHSSSIQLQLVFLDVELINYDHYKAK